MKVRERVESTGLTRSAVMSWRWMPESGVASVKPDMLRVDDNCG